MGQHCLASITSHPLTHSPTHPLSPPIPVFSPIPELVLIKTIGSIATQSCLCLYRRIFSGKVMWEGRSESFDEGKGEGGKRECIAPLKAPSAAHASQGTPRIATLRSPAPAPAPAPPPPPPCPFPDMNVCFFQTSSLLRMDSKEQETLQ
jgi:hypothetical protein